MNRDAARQSATKHIAAIIRATDAGRHRYARHLLRAYLSRYVVKLDAAYSVLGANASYEDASRLARRIDLYAPCCVPVLWRPIPKRTQGVRIVCKLPRVLRAAHLIIQDVLQAVYRPGGHAFNIKRRGRDVEARAIQAAMEKGYRYCYVGDLKDAFQAVNIEALYQLPLPNTVIRNMLDCRNLRLRRVRMDKTTHAIHTNINSTKRMPNGPSGLMQGSPVSNLILNWLFDSMPSVLPSDSEVFLFSDNVLVATKEEDQCRAVEQTLGQYFLTHQAGPFVIIGQVEPIESGIERMGYFYDYSAIGKKVRIDISHLNYEKIYTAVEEAIIRDLEAGHSTPVVAARVLQQKLNGFSASTEREIFEEAMMQAMHEQLSWARK